MGRIPGRAAAACVEAFRRVLRASDVRPQHTFDFLRGDPTPRYPLGAKLRVDAYFPAFSLVVEYMGAQHFTENTLMDRRPGRRAQRARYQQRRSDVLTQRGITLIRHRYDEPLTDEHLLKKLRAAGIPAHSDSANGSQDGDPGIA